MAKFLERLTGKGDNRSKAQETITRLSSEHVELRVEIENTSLFFHSKLLLRSGAVVLMTPRKLQKHLSEGSWVRVRLPAAEKKDLRLQISSAKQGGSGQVSAEMGNVTVLCKIPGASVVVPKRSADRFVTSQFGDLFLNLPSHPSPYPILDISRSGVRVRIAKSEDAARFPIGSYIEQGGIQLGQKVQVSLLDVHPRVHFPDAVGMEMTVNPDGNSRKILQIFLETMEKQVIASGGEGAKPNSS